jgi:3-hydroxyisobutyrate dehydrogenase
MSEKIGFIGLGSQGGPIAHRIADAGMNLTVWARRPEALETFATKGCTTAHSVTQMGQRCDHIGICVVSDADVFQITDQLIPVMKSGSRIVIHSTILPATCQQLEAQCKARGIGLIDAPVSGGSPAAEAGTLTVMCGGDSAVFEECKPVFETFGKMIVLLGGIGAGQRAKIINNALLSAHLGIATAALTVADELGVDRSALAALVRESSGRSFGFEVAARMASPAAFTHGATMLDKDIRLLRTLLPESGGAQALEAAAADFLAAALAG